MPSSCPFCTVPKERVVIEDAACIVIRDGFPVSPGHSLVIPRRHFESFFETSAVERESIMCMLHQIKKLLDGEFRPEGYNIGINDGCVAGQTVPHLHVHLIPRYSGDCADPRGGVRWVIPEKASYWK